MTTFTDLEAARAQLASLQETFDRYSGNNPEKYRSDINAASARVIG